jgi:Zn-finger protein
MRYSDWYEKFVQRRDDIVDKLPLSDARTVADYFDYDNISRKDISFCPLFERGVKCHDMESLNCYFCACPYFRFDDDGLDEVDGKRLYSICTIDAPRGKRLIRGDVIHQDCSECTIPHSKSFVMKRLGKNGSEGDER